MVGGLALLLAVGAQAATWNFYSVVDNIDSNNYDLAISENKAHVVYEKAGQIYYATASASDTTWRSQLIGAGTNASIAATESGDAYIVYSNNGSIYESTSAGNWASSVIGAGSVATIDVPRTGGVRHVLIEGDADGNGRTDFSHIANSGTGWGASELIQSGYYDSGSGYYVGQSSITALSNGGYAYALEAQGWGGSASWSTKYPSAIIPGVSDTNMGVEWNTGSQLTRNAISSYGDVVGYTFATGGHVYGNAYMGGSWTGFQDLGTGSDASGSMSEGGGVAFVRDGKLMFWDGTATSTVSYNGTDLTGSLPVLYGAHESFILFKDNSGNLAFTMTSPVPEPGSMAALASGLVGLSTFAIRRRRR